MEERHQSIANAHFWSSTAGPDTQLQDYHPHYALMVPCPWVGMPTFLASWGTPRFLLYSIAKYGSSFVSSSWCSMRWRSLSSKWTARCWALCWPSSRSSPPIPWSCSSYCCEGFSKSGCWPGPLCSTYMKAARACWIQGYMLPWIGVGWVH
jgi:hypothetical protein